MLTISKKIDRQKVYEKYDGHCAYCGCEIEYRQMQVDHIIPKARFPRFQMSLEVSYGLDDINNLNPACRVCNKWKDVFLVEDFRREVSLQVQRARGTSANFRMAERYGQIQITESPIIFYFEKTKTQHQNED